MAVLKPTLTVHFEGNDGTKPTHLLAEAEIHFHEGTGPFEGLKLVGFSVWKAADGGTYITGPSRAFGTGTERRYFDYIRSSDGDHKRTKQIKDFVHEAWRTEREK